MSLIGGKNFVLLFDHENRIEEKLGDYVQSKINETFSFVDINNTNLKLIFSSRGSRVLRITYDIMESGKNLQNSDFKKLRQFVEQNTKLFFLIEYYRKPIKELLVLEVERV